jgi:hypothetical protein
MSAAGRLDAGEATTGTNLAWHGRSEIGQQPGEHAMCQGDDKDCAHFEEHRRKFLGELGHERRAFLKSAAVAAGGLSAAAGGLSLVTPAMARAAAAAQSAHNSSLDHALVHDQQTSCASDGRS